MKTVYHSQFDTLFPDVRETGETQLRQCQLVMLRMLKIFDHLCRRHNIQYFLTGGSMLGSIRHKGFIPWDDDLDIGMTRKNYEKFVKVAVAELPQDIFFQSTDTDPYLPMYHIAEAKLRDKYSHYVRKPELDKLHRWHNGLQCDIFVYDRAFFPSNKAIYLVNHFFRKKLGRYRGHNVRASILQLLEWIKPLPLVYASTYIHKRYMVKFGTNYIRPEELRTLEQVPFEDMMTFVPGGWKACLERQYGDFMKLPPAEKQTAPHGTAVADPFTPCDHKEILYWEDRKNASKKTAS